LKNKIQDLIEKYNVEIDTTEKQLNLELAHAKSSVYGAIKYALRIKISKGDIKHWFSEFEDDNDLINGINPFDSLNMSIESGLEKLNESDYLKNEFNFDPEDIKNMSNEEIIQELKNRGVSFTGNRNELIAKFILSSNKELLKSLGIKTNN